MLTTWERGVSPAVLANIAMLAKAAGRPRSQVRKQPSKRNVYFSFAFVSLAIFR